MITFDEAIRKLAEISIDCGTEYMSVDRAHGYRLAEDIVSPMDSPPFDSSAMDGFAVGSEGLGPWHVVGEAAAGGTWSGSLASREAIRIFTGAPVPFDAEAVIPVESATCENKHLTSNFVVQPGAHIRRRGEEFSAGATVLCRGTRITPPIQGALSSLGLDRIRIHSRPAVGILVTGNELLAPGTERTAGMIYESHSVGISSALSSLGFKNSTAKATDDLKELRTQAEQLLQSNAVIVSTGGVSVGAYDYVPETLTQLGFENVFHGVAMKPGKPIMVARRSDGKVWFGLPGNPQSAWTGLLLFVLPFLGEPLEAVTRALAVALSRKPGREEFYPATYKAGWAVEILPSVGSHANFALTEADCLVRIPAHCDGVEAGSEVTAITLPWRRQ